MKVIALEEHFATIEVIQAWKNVDPPWRDLALKASTEGEEARRLLDVGPGRLAAMDDAGIDVAVLSLTTPGVQNLDPANAERLARSSNDWLAAAVRSQPERLAGFATLATPSPNDAAKELERAVCSLGLDGAMLHGRTREKNLSDREFWPVFEAADALHAPLYLHPQSPQRSVLDAYYSGLGNKMDSLFASAGIGWHYETGIQILRLILSGIFDRFPNLQIITGHWGEVMLFYLDRIDMMSHAAKLPFKISEYVQQHIHVTPSGVYSQRYLRWALEVLGPDRILFATDYPFAPAARDATGGFFESAQLSGSTRIKIASANWDRLRKGIRR